MLETFRPNPDSKHTAMFLLRYNWAFYFLLALWENVGGIYGSMAMLWRFIVKACQKVEAIEQHILPLTTS